MKISSSGFTLLEVVLSMVLASAILAAILILNAPFVSGFSEGLNFQRLRHQVSNPLDGIKKEVLAARAVYVDTNQCYALCLIDKGSGNRTIYYWSGSDLLRKSESSSTSLSCTNGKKFATSMDKTNSGFSQFRELTTMKLAATGTNSIFYRLFTSAMPTNVERNELFYDGFGCKSDVGKGWTLSNTGTISWAVASSSGASGAYWLYQTLRTNQATALVATAEITVNLARVDDAYLQFKYRTSGSMDPGEYLTVNFYDGTWHEIFRDDLGGSISALSTTTLNLDGYGLSEDNKIRFDGYLMNKNDHWIIDEVSVVSK